MKAHLHWPSSSVALQVRIAVVGFGTARVIEEAGDTENLCVEFSPSKVNV